MAIMERREELYEPNIGQEALRQAITEKQDAR